MTENFWVGMVRNGCDQSGGETLKLTVTEGWTDRINWFFAYWYRFSKIKGWSIIFWVGMVQSGQSAHGTQKLTVS